MRGQLLLWNFGLREIGLGLVGMVEVNSLPVCCVAGEQEAVRSYKCFMFLDKSTAIVYIHANISCSR